jgi:DNA polymerase III epsilon subunit-like protein
VNTVLALFSRGTADTGVDLAMPIEAARYVVMDTELTGLDVRKDSIVSVGAVIMKGGRILLGETFYEMVSPETAMRSASIVIHGITPSDVADKPSIDVVIEDLVKFCEGAVVVGHFVSLDLGFLNKEMKRLHNAKFPQPVVDTLQMHGCRTTAGDHAASTMPARRTRTCSVWRKNMLSRFPWRTTRSWMRSSRRSFSNGS